MSEESAEYEVENTVHSRPILQRIDGVAQQIESLEMSINNQAAPPVLHDKMFAALAAAQGDISAAEASQTNEHFDYTYANLQNCLDACRKPLADNELAVIQLPTVLETGAVQVRTILGHSSGQSISQVMQMQPDKGGPQAVGSCITYLRRYMLCAMVGIGQQDDDANLATKDPDEYDRISKTQVDEILVLADNLFKKSADAVVERMLAKVFELTSVKDIPRDLFEQAKTLLENQAKREKGATKPKPKTDKEKLAEANKDASK